MQNRQLLEVVCVMMTNQVPSGEDRRFCGLLDFENATTVPKSNLRINAILRTGQRECFAQKTQRVE
jgi:hypothetical protein